MKDKLLLLTVVFIFLVLLCVWAPWVTPSFAVSKAEESFELSYAGVLDGCSIDKANGGVQFHNKAPFGAIVTINYNCSMKMEFRDGKYIPVTYLSEYFVSAFGTVHKPDSFICSWLACEMAKAK